MTRAGNSGPQHLRHVAALIFVLSGCPESEPPVATIRAVSGEVTWRTTAEGAEQKADTEVALREGNIVSTGEDGRAAVEFQGGNAVDLQPNTTLVIRKVGGSTAQFGAVLLSGSANASSTGRGVLLAIGTPFGLTELGAAESSLEVSLERGITVHVGEVALLTGQGRQTLSAGMSFSVDGIEIEIEAKCKSDADCAAGEACNPETSACEKILALPPMEFVLIANPRQVRIKRAGTTKWVTPKKHETLGPGDAVRTRRASGTRVHFGDIARLTMRKNTEMVFDAAGASGESHRARYGLVAGNVLVHLAQNEKVGAEHEIEVAGTSVKVAPGLLEAAVEIATVSEDKANIKVRFGRVVLSDGTTVDAGTAVTVEKGAVADEGIKPIAFTQVDLHPLSSPIVYFSSEVPPIQFVWPDEKGVKSYELEVASDRKFARTVFRERLPRNTFVYDRFGPGRYFWRVKGEGEWIKGALSIKKKRARIAQIKRRNDVIDSGENTVIYYQKVLPALNFKWTAVSGATRYKLKVYTDREFERPFADVTVVGTSHTFAEGDFDEGVYHWHQVALDANGKDVRQGRMNTLTIAYDNATVDLAIKTPRPRQRVSSGSLTTQGEVQLGARLSINGRRAHLDSKGRFRESIKLDKGANQIVYRTFSSDGVERYYVLNVVRR